jgi:Cu-Zn family superoxide dismutase
MFRVVSTLVTVLLLLAGFGGVASASRPAQSTPDQYTLPGDVVYPEGIAYDRETRSFYVGSTTDGTIYRGTLGNPNTTVFSPGGADGRTSATGMKVDPRGRLYVCGAGTGLLFVYDTRTGALLGMFDTKSEPNTFINDVTITPNGDAYFTDSVSPYLYRVSADASGTLAYERWLDFTGSALTYAQGFNVNGITATGDGAYLIVVQSNTGKLYRISTATKQVSQINVGSETFTAGDGILLAGDILHVMRNQLALLVSVRLSNDYSTGTVISTFTSPGWAYPTTFALAGDRALVVNSQFDKRSAQQAPNLPFTVAGTVLRAAATGGQPPGMPTTGSAGPGGLLLLLLGAGLLLGGDPILTVARVRCFGILRPQSPVLKAQPLVQLDRPRVFHVHMEAHGGEALPLERGQHGGDQGGPHAAPAPRRVGPHLRDPAHGLPQVGNWQHPGGDEADRLPIACAGQQREVGAEVGVVGIVGDPLGAVGRGRAGAAPGAEGGGVGGEKVVRVGLRPRLGGDRRGNDRQRAGQVVLHPVLGEVAGVGLPGVQRRAAVGHHFVADGQGAGCANGPRGLLTPAQQVGAQAPAAVVGVDFASQPRLPLVDLRPAGGGQVFRVISTHRAEQGGVRGDQQPGIGWVGHGGGTIYDPAGGVQRGEGGQVRLDAAPPGIRFHSNRILSLHHRAHGDHRA